jgi:prepilin-type N-terminal cleavage/methylation domain-containing protein
MTHDRRAFSLVEILVAVTIMTIALVAILSHSLTARRGVQATAEEIRGVGFAEDLIDRVKTMKYEDIPELDKAPDDESFPKLGIGAAGGTSGGASTEGASGDAGALVELEPTPEPFKRFVTVEEVEQDFSSVKAKMKRVTVKVAWTVKTLKESGNIERPVRIQLVSLVRKQFN